MNWKLTIGGILVTFGIYVFLHALQCILDGKQDLWKDKLKKSPLAIF